MDTTLAVKCLSALGHPGRLDVYRLLVRHAPDGLNAGDIASAFDHPASTMSSQLRVLTEAGLVTSRRKGREIHFRPDIDRMRELVLFIVADCCGGDPERSGPLLAELLPCCP